MPKPRLRTALALQRTKTLSPFRDLSAAGMCIFDGGPQLGPILGGA
jgi:hypothetical protein